jgi:hypothetical protein
MTGPLLASALGAQLKEWADTGYYPPALACCEPHPLDPSTLCHRIACNGSHSADGLPPWTDTPDPKDDNHA